MIISENLYPSDLLENKRYRLHLLQKAQNNHLLQVLLKQKCQEDILFFINTFGWTYDPRMEPSDIPFITYQYQDDALLTLVTCIETEQDAWIEKSRDMGFSWMMVALQAYGFISGWSSLYGSYKEDYVDSKGDMDSHFERLRFFLNKLPYWLLPQDMTDTYMNISSQESHCSVTGDAGQNFGTGGRRKFIVLDEFALWQNDKKAYRKTKDIARCRIFGGTPEGKYNVYGQVMTKTGDYADLDVVRIRLHWTLHPKKDLEWYEHQKKTRTPLDIAKELDISYEDSVTGAVYPEFNQRVMITRDVPFNPKLPLFTAWDFGRDMNAVIWLQKDWLSDQVFVIDSYQVMNKPIEYLASFVTGKQEIDEETGLPFEYDDEEKRKIDLHRDWVSAYAMHCGDPYNGGSVQTNARSSIKQILRRYGIDIVTKRDSTLEDRIRRVHLLLPRLSVDKSQYNLLQAMSQSRYPDDTKSMTREKTKPIHDVYSHFRTAMEYFADNEPTKDPYKPREKTVQRLDFNPLTGESINFSKASIRD